MIYNQSVLNKLAVKDKQSSFATLSAKGVSFSFLINPEKTDWKISSEFSSLPVLLTPQPQLRYKSSTSSLSFPKVLFFGPGDNYDVLPLITQLRTWIQTGTELTLIFGLLNTQCYISSFNFSVIQIREGTPTKIEGSLEFLIIPSVLGTGTQPVLDSSKTTREKNLNKTAS